jgi:hypothetical protein
MILQICEQLGNEELYETIWARREKKLIFENILDTIEIVGERDLL